MWSLDDLLADHDCKAPLCYFKHLRALTDNSCCVLPETGFDDMDSIYASPEDFKRAKKRDKVRGLHLLEYFVGRCHEYGVIEN